MKFKKLIPITFAALLGLTGCASPQITAEEQHKREYAIIENKILEGARDNQTLMVGDQHEFSFERNFNYDFFLNLLPKLKEQGYGHLALEIDYHLQKPIDDFVKGNCNEQEMDSKIIDILNKEYNLKFAKLDKKDESMGVLETFFGKEILNPQTHIDSQLEWTRGSYELIKKAKQTNMNVDCIDNMIDNSSFIPLFDRDDDMYVNICRRVFNKNPNAKIVFYLGAYHVNEKKFINKKFGELNPLGSRIAGMITAEKNYSVVLPFWMPDEENMINYVDLDFNKKETAKIKGK